MNNQLKIAVASGKGGTGKTTVAVNLAVILAGLGKRVQYLDCDVEEPNGHIFLKPEITSRSAVTVSIPEVIEEKCNACRICASVCEYKAVALIKETVLIFPELCHSCGACSLLCPEGALAEVANDVGALETGEGSGIKFAQGRLHIGQIAAPAVIKAVKGAEGNCEIAILDCPPGTSCNVIEAVKDADLVILVTEPTPFGLNDLYLAVEMTKALGKPFGVIINRYDIGNDEVLSYCIGENIDIVMKIPDDRRIAEAYARGDLVVTSNDMLREMLADSWDRIRECLEKVSADNNRDRGKRETEAMA